MTHTFSSIDISLISFPSVWFFCGNKWRLLMILHGTALGPFKTFYWVWRIGLLGFSFPYLDRISIQTAWLDFMWICAYYLCLLKYFTATI